MVKIAIVKMAAMKKLRKMKNKNLRNSMINYHA